MALFVHLAPAKLTPRILRGGIKPAKRRAGVYALPVVRNFYVSHQWLRELRRRGDGPYVAVSFRIPDDEPVLVGHYGSPHVTMTAVEAASVLMNESRPREGWEVIVERKIEPDAIHRVRSLRQVVGWRYFPGAHGRPPCPCEFCQRGLFGGRKIIERADQ